MTPPTELQRLGQDFDRGGEDEGVPCETCQGNGEIITDWNRYLHAFPDDNGDEAVAECPDCDGRGLIPLEERR